MRSAAGAARRRQEREPEPGPEPDPVAAAVAEIGRIVAASDATQRRLGRHERALRSELAAIARLAAGCPDAELLAAAADKASDRLGMVTVELISDGAHNAEAREALERCAAALEAGAQAASFTEVMRRAAVDAATAPLLAEIAELRAAAERDARPRAPGAHRKRHLRVAGTALATGAVAASLAGGTVIAAHDSASVHAYAASRPVARMHEAPPDFAVPVSSSPAYQPRHAKPTADAASASPAPSPSVTLPPSSPAPPPPPSPAPSLVAFTGQLDVQTDHLVIGPLQGAQLTFSAVGGPLSWTASAPDGLVLSARSGILGDGQAVVIEVTVAVGTAAGSGVVVITDGDGRSVSVPVTWAAVPAI